jgi:hypothetical protein
MVKGVLRAGFGMFKVFTGPTVVTTLSISLVWIIYSAIPPYLLLHYNFIGRGATLRWACTLCFLISSLCGIAAITLLWLVYPTQVRAHARFIHFFQMSVMLVYFELCEL